LHDKKVRRIRGRECNRKGISGTEKEEKDREREEKIFKKGKTENLGHFISSLQCEGKNTVPR